MQKNSPRPPLEQDGNTMINLEKPFSVLRSPFSVLRSPFSVLRSPFSLIRRNFPFVLVTLILTLSACLSPYGGEEGTLTLNLGGGSGGSRSIAYEPGGIGPGADIGELEFRLRLSGPGGTYTETARGAGAIRLSLAPGSWTVQADAYYQGVLYAVSDPLAVEVKAGGNNSATLHMRPATKAYNDDDFGAGATVNYLYFSGNDDPTELEARLSDIMNVPGNYAVIVEGTQHTIQGGVLAIASGVTLSLRGSGTVNLGTTYGRMFDLASGGSGNKLILRGPTLHGNNNLRVVDVRSGEFVMHAGEISGNTTTTNGGGVYVDANGTFNMHGGTISGNTAPNGAGVFVNGIFNMNGGTISGNNAINATYGGGGVSVVDGGQFTMSGGSISGNNATTLGGGVNVLTTVSGRTATFNMQGGTISGNTANGTGASDGGGGVYVRNNGGTAATFTMSGGSISGNNQAANGGGVTVYGSGSQFNMSGSAVISGNSATSNGGGVYTAGAAFTMNGSAVISGNSATYGGGLFLTGSGTFTMSGGIIYGTPAGSPLANTGASLYKAGGTATYGNGSTDIISSTSTSNTIEGGTTGTTH